MQAGQIEDVSDTAFMVATYRAIESSRADALFRDPLAAKLAGPHGEEIVGSRPKWALIGQWLVAIRTRIIDAFIEDAMRSLAAPARPATNPGVERAKRDFAAEYAIW